MSDPRVHPTREDPLVASVSTVVGGPVGARAGRHRWWTPVRVLLALAAVVFALGMVQKVDCYQDSWQDGTSRYTHMCYSDLPYLYTLRGFAELSWPYSDDPQVRDRYEPMEYPVVISYYAYATAWVTHWLSGSPSLEPRYDQRVEALSSGREVRQESRLYVAVNAVGFAVVTLLATWLLAGVDRRRPWDAALFAVSPALALNALVNWDTLAVVFVAAALWAWSRDRPALTGVMIGLGAATKLFPLFLLGGLLVICLRDRRIGDFCWALATSVLAWLLIDLPAYVSGPSEWAHFWSFNSGRGADLGSIWLLLQQTTNHEFTAATINHWSWAVFGLWCVGVLVLGLRAPGTPRLAQLGFLVVAGFLLVNKVYSPQYVLWLLPLAALARPRWRDVLVWQAGECLYFAMVWWYLGGFLDPGGDGDAGFYWIAIIVRMLAELYLVVIVARDVWVGAEPGGAHFPAQPGKWGSPPQEISTRSNVVAV